MNRVKRPWFIFGSSLLQSAASRAEQPANAMEMGSKQRQESNGRAEGIKKSQSENQMLSHSRVRDDPQAEQSASFKKLLAFVFCLVCFMALCAVAFSFLESDNEHEQMVYWETVERGKIKDLNISKEEFKQLLFDLEKYKRYGLSATTKWDFYNAFWFTMTITTTIGFGHITPVTSGGRLFCILCGLLGIPLNALVLKHVGNKIRLWVTNVIHVTETQWCGRRKCKNVEVKCACVLFLFMIIVILLGGCLDLMFDGWTFTDGIYFNFIALSTIGFGDIYPSVTKPSKLDNLGLSPTGKRLLGSAIMAVYLTLGLAIVSSVVVSILTAMESVDKAKKKIVSWRKRGATHTRHHHFSLRKNADSADAVDSFENRYRKEFGF